MMHKMLNQMLYAKAYSETRQTPKTERFSTTINGY